MSDSGQPKDAMGGAYRFSLSTVPIYSEFRGGAAVGLAYIGSVGSRSLHARRAGVWSWIIVVVITSKHCLLLLLLLLRLLLMMMMIRSVI